jgi:hypothetical protein
LVGPCGVVAEAGVDGVADATFERSDRFFAAVAFGDLAVVVGAPFAVTVTIWVTAAMWMAWLRRRLPRRDSRKILRRPGGYLDRCGAVVGGEGVTAGEAGHIADVTDDGGGDDRTDPRTAR